MESNRMSDRVGAWWGDDTKGIPPPTKTPPQSNTQDMTSADVPWKSPKKNRGGHVLPGSVALKAQNKKQIL